MPPNLAERVEAYVAAHVELRTAALAGSVEGDRLGADEVVAGGDLAGELEGALAAVRVEEVGAPGLGAGVVAVLVDLEPVTAAVGRGGVVHLAHVHHDGAEVVPADGLVAAGPVVHLRVHLDGEVIASYKKRYVSRQREGQWMGGPARTVHFADLGDARGAANVANDVSARHARDWRVVGLRFQVSHRTTRGLVRGTPTGMRVHFVSKSTPALPDCWKME